MTVASFDSVTGNLNAQQTISSLPEGVAGTRAHHRGNSHIEIHPNGQFLYVGIRSPDPGLIAVFSISADGRTIAPLQHESTQGLVPRNFKIVPTSEGMFLVVGNQESQSVLSFVIDDATGLLTAAGSVSTAPFKACNISFWMPNSVMDSSNL